MASEGEASPPRKRMLLELPSEHQSQNLTQVESLLFTSHTICICLQNSKPLVPTSVK